MTCLPLLLVVSACGHAASPSELTSDEQRRQKAPTIAQELERLYSLSKPDQLFLLIRSDEHRPLYDFPDAARNLVVALVSDSGVAPDRGWGEGATVSIQINTRIYLNEPDGTFHEIAVQRPALVPGGQGSSRNDDLASQTAERLTERKESARRMIERFRAFRIISNLLTAEDFLRKRTKVSDLSTDDRDRLLWEMRFGKAMSDMNAIHGLLADDERFGDTSVRVSAQVVMTIADTSHTAIRVYSMP